MAKNSSTSTSQAKSGAGKRSGGSLVSRFFHGRLISIEFFKRHWLPVLVSVLLILVYITNKYSYQTRVETANALRKELEVIKTEYIRQRSLYMSNTRESAMRRRIDSIGLDLTYQVQPPYTLSYGE